MSTEVKEKPRGATTTKGGLRTLSVAAILCALLGGAFFWWVPFGMVVSVTGLMFGFVDWTIARRRSLDYRLSILAMLLAVAALALDIAIYALGLQILTFGGR